MRTQLKHRDDVDLDIAAERMLQDVRFGQQNHEPFKWLSILTEEVGEAAQAANDSYNWKTGSYNSDLEQLRAELVQVAAVAKAFIECLDRNSWR